MKKDKVFTLNQDLDKEGWTRIQEAERIVKIPHQRMYEGVR